MSSPFSAASGGSRATSHSNGPSSASRSTRSSAMPSAADANPIRRECQMNGGTGLGDGYFPLLGTIRPAKVIAKAFRAGFHRIAHLARPFPVGSRERVTR